MPRPYPDLPPALAGERFEFDSPAGRLSCYRAGSGPAMLLVHSINASASGAEVRPLYMHYSSDHTVFAVDLPGFGFSERSDRAYTPRLMTDALLATAAEIERRVPGPIDALALSLSCEYLARAEAEVPGRFARLALVSPTGFNGRTRRRAPPGTTRGLPWLYKLLRGPTPGWRQGLFRGLTRPGVIRYFLARTWGSPQIDEELWRYCLLSSQQPGAEFAPLHFLSANLFSADVHTLYEQLTGPVWVCHGTRGDFTDYRSLDLVSGRPNWRSTVFEAAGALPYFELPERFFASAGPLWLGR